MEKEEEDPSQPRATQGHDRARQSFRAKPQRMTFLVHVLLANLHEAVQHDWGRDLFESHQKLRKRYPYSTVQTTATL
eukprot:scaffold21158_cov71-Cyclotella_meneghiniana.AAC.11